MNQVDENLVKITIESDRIEGDLGIQEGAKGIVLFAHGAGHLFTEPGALEEVASLTKVWFSKFLHT